MPAYYDSLGIGPPTARARTVNFYVYFSAYGNGGYDPNDVNFLGDSTPRPIVPIGSLYYGTAVRPSQSSIRPVIRPTLTPAR